MLGFTDGTRLPRMNESECRERERLEHKAQRTTSPKECGGEREEDEPEKQETKLRETMRERERERRKGRSVGGRARY